MYSFVPALPTGPPYPRFARPALDYHTMMISYSSSSGVIGASDPRRGQDVRKAWEEIRRQVLDARLALGVTLDTPTCRTMDGGPIRSADFHQSG